MNLHAYPNPAQGTPTVKPQDYTAIQIAGGIFLIIIIIALGINISISRSLKEDATEINIAGRQRMLSQRMTKAQLAISERLRTEEPEKLKKALKELKITSSLFDDSLSAFLNGGKIAGADGLPVSIRKVKDPKLVRTLTESKEIWNEITIALAPLIDTNPNTLSEASITYANGKLSEHNLALLRLMNDLTVGLEKKSTQKSATLSWVLFGAALFVIINFIYIVVLSINKLRKGDLLLQQYSQSLVANNNNLIQTNQQLETTQSQLQVAYQSLQTYSQEADSRANELQDLSSNLKRMKEESDAIFQSIDHGLFLVDQKFCIGSRISSAMHRIFETKELSGKNFLDLMRPLVSEKDVKTLESYLKLQFNGKTLTKQLNKFNPLKEIELTMNWDGQNFINKNVSFDFERVMEGKEVVDILVTVTDITEKVAMENKLKKASEDESKKTEAILELIQAEPQELDLFLTQAEKTLDEINEALRHQGIQDTKQLKLEKKSDLVEFIFRKIHNIKGNSSMLGLSSLSQISHLIENDLQKLRNRTQISGDDFLSSLVHMVDLREAITHYLEVKQTLLKNFANRSEPSRTTSSKSQQLATDLNQLTQPIALEIGKSVFLRSSFQLDDFSQEPFQQIKDVLIQLTRNSVIHGIEPKDQRVATGKLEDGIIHIKSRFDDSSTNPLGEPAYHFVYRDDGAGLDVTQIKEQAIKQNLLSAEEARTLAPSSLARFIFSPGFSTSKQITNHAGRGTGMDLVKDIIIEQLGGKMSLSYKMNHHFQLSWIIPASRVNKAITTPKISV